MAAPSNLFLSFFIFCFMFSSGLGSFHHHHHRHHQRLRFQPKHLFVFGDSYADTGNIRKPLGALSYTWREPYGMTFPGKPTGRFSDGRVLTDFLARFFVLRTPWAYQWRKMVGMDKLNHGINFAYGGSGVFDTKGTLLPNMTVQIDLFEKVLNASMYTKQDLKSSIAVVSCVGNDYGTWLNQHPNEPVEDILNFIPMVIEKLGQKLKRIYDLGIPKVLVTGMQPIGCSPRITWANQFKNCSDLTNMMVLYHNELLNGVLATLNNMTTPIKSTFFKLDLYDAFTSVIENKGNAQVNVKFESPLVPACFGIDKDHFCGDRDENGNKLYTLGDPNTSLYWDASHPTQLGWKAIFNHLEPNLTKFLSSY